MSHCTECLRLVGDGIKSGDPLSSPPHMFLPQGPGTFVPQGMVGMFGMGEDQVLPQDFDNFTEHRQQTRQAEPAEAPKGVVVSYILNLDNLLVRELVLWSMIDNSEMLTLFFCFCYFVHYSNMVNNCISGVLSRCHAASFSCFSVFSQEARKEGTHYKALLLTLHKPMSLILTPTQTRNL